MTLDGNVDPGEPELALSSSFNLTVRRSHLIEDVLNHLNRFENEDLRRELLVKYNAHLVFLLLREETRGKM